MRMKQQFYALISTVTIVAILLAFFSCENSDYDFKNPSEAITACRQKLSILRKTDVMSIKDISDEISDWLILRDSAYNIIFLDSLDSDIQLNETFLVLTDSIHDEIKRLVFSETRSMTDLVFLRIHTTKNKTERQSSEDYKIARDFYDRLNDEIYPDMNSTLLNYKKLLNSKPFKNEAEMQSFIKEEDRCFRSLMNVLADISQDRLDEISAGTARYFDNLTLAVAKDLGNERNRSIATFLTMRLNRRIIQNAMACASDIRNNVSLTENRALTYRWMVIQPFFSMDDYALALLNDHETDCLEDLANEIPDLLIMLDKHLSPDSQQDVDELTKTMVEYFFETYVDFLL